MRILVVDDERSLGSLLGRALKRLGHEATVSTLAEDAIELVRSRPFDAVITDIALPGMHGVELARAMRRERAHLPIAFCTGMDPHEERLAEAAELGHVLPRVWTVADVKKVVRDLRAQLPQNRERSRTGSQPWPEGSSRADAAPGGEAMAETARQPSAEPMLRKVRVVCEAWNQVARLCGANDVKTPSLTLRGSRVPERGQRLSVNLCLPDAAVLPLEAEVTEVLSVPGPTALYVVAVTGLTPALRARLRARCRQAQPGGQSPGSAGANVAKARLAGS